MHSAYCQNLGLRRSEPILSGFFLSLNSEIELVTSETLKPGALGTSPGNYQLFTFLSFVSTSKLFICSRPLWLLKMWLLKVCSDWSNHLVCLHCPHPFPILHSLQIHLVLWIDMWIVCALTHPCDAIAISTKMKESTRMVYCRTYDTMLLQLVLCYMRNAWD